MLRAAVTFFVLGLVAYAIGAGDVGIISIGVGKTILEVFVVLAILSFIGSLFSGKTPRIP